MDSGSYRLPVSPALFWFCSRNRGLEGSQRHSSYLWPQSWHPLPLQARTLTTDLYIIDNNLSPAEVDRYQRQLQLPLWSLAAQRQLKMSQVVVLGLSSLSLAAAGSLIWAGLGRLRLVDTDRVSLADLGGLFREIDLHKPKAKVAQARLQEANPFAEIELINRPPSHRNLGDILSGAQLVLSDLNSPPVAGPSIKAIWKQKLPWLLAGLNQERGYMILLLPGTAACPDCSGLWEQFPPQAPYLAPMATVLGGLLAYEAMTFLCRQEALSLGRFFYFDFTTGATGHLELQPPRPDCPVCRPTPASDPVNCSD